MAPGLHLWPIDGILWVVRSVPKDNIVILAIISWAVEEPTPLIGLHFPGQRLSKILMGWMEIKGKKKR